MGLGVLPLVLSPLTFQLVLTNLFPNPKGWDLFSIQFTSLRCVNHSNWQQERKSISPYHYITASAFTTSPFHHFTFSPFHLSPSHKSFTPTLKGGICSCYFSLPNTTYQQTRIVTNTTLYKFWLFLVRFGVLILIRWFWCLLSFLILYLYFIYGVSMEHLG